MAKKHTAAPSMNIGKPSPTYHVNPGQLPKGVPGIHSRVGEKGPKGMGYKPPKC